MTPSTKWCSSIFDLGPLKPKICSPKFAQNCLYVCGSLSQSWTVSVGQWVSHSLWIIVCGSTKFGLCTEIQSPTGLFCLILMSSLSYCPYRRFLKSYQLPTSIRRALLRSLTSPSLVVSERKIDKFGGISRFGGTVVDVLHKSQCFLVAVDQSQRVLHWNDSQQLKTPA